MTSVLEVSVNELVPLSVHSERLKVLLVTVCYLVRYDVVVMATCERADIVHFMIGLLITPGTRSELHLFRFNFVHVVLTTRSRYGPSKTLDTERK